MPATIDVVAFDADDTLWHNESLYRDIEARFVAMMAPFATEDEVQAALRDLDIRNVPQFGYGIKAFTLSMVEAAVEVSAGTITGREIAEVIAFAREMVSAPVDLLPGVAETVPQVARAYPLLLITKGDLLDQEAKVARSGLAEHFDAVHVVSEKNPDVYARIFTAHGYAPQRVLMVGNSLKSDVLPVVELGGHGVHIPYHTTWAHEVVPDEVKRQADFHALERVWKVGIIA